MASNVNLMVLTLACVLSSAMMKGIIRKSVPGKPRIIYTSERKPRSFVVYWEAPRHANGVLESYQVQWTSNNIETTRTFSGNLINPMSAHISGLEPYTEYKIRVRAATSDGYGEYSDIYPTLTDVEGPSAPKIVNVTVLSSTKIYVRWEKPKQFYKHIDSYKIKFWSRSGDIVEERRAAGYELETEINDIPTNNEYTLKIAGSTKSIFYQSSYIGEFSDEVEFALEGIDENQSCEECFVNGRTYPPNADFTLHFGRCHRVFCKCFCDGQSNCYDWSRECID